MTMPATRATGTLPAFASVLLLLVFAAPPCSSMNVCDVVRSGNVVYESEEGYLKGRDWIIAKKLGVGKSEAFLAYSYTKERADECRAKTAAKSDMPIEPLACQRWHGIRPGCVVLKEISFTHFATAEQEIKAAKLLNKLNHPSIMHVYGATSHGFLGKVYTLYYEFGGRDLTNYLELMPSREALRRSINMQLLDAVAVLSSHGVVHHDLKPDNIMLKDFFDEEGNPTDDPRKAVSATPVVIDFGMAIVRDHGEETWTARIISQKRTQQSRWPPPEIEPMWPQWSWDMWQLGVVFGEMLWGKQIGTKLATPVRSDVLKSFLDDTKSSEKSTPDAFDPRLGRAVRARDIYEFFLVDDHKFRRTPLGVIRLLQDEKAASALKEYASRYISSEADQLSQPFKLFYHKVKPRSALTLEKQNSVQVQHYMHESMMAITKQKETGDVGVNNKIKSDEDAFSAKSMQLPVGAKAAIVDCDRFVQLIIKEYVNQAESAGNQAKTDMADVFRVDTVNLKRYCEEVWEYSCAASFIAIEKKFRRGCRAQSSYLPNKALGTYLSNKKALGNRTRRQRTLFPVGSSHESSLTIEEDDEGSTHRSYLAEPTKKDLSASSEELDDDNSGTEESLKTPSLRAVETLPKAPGQVP